MGSALTIKKAKENRGTILLVGSTQKDLRNVMISSNPSSIIEISPPDFKPTWNVTYNTLEWPNGCKAIGISADAGGSPGSGARGHSAYFAWIDELAKIGENAEEVFTQVDLAVRGIGSMILTTTTPTPINIIKKLYNKVVEEKDPLYYITTGSTFENAANLDPNYLKSLKEAYFGTIYYEQEVLGKIIFSSDNALFKRDDLEKNRVSKEELPELEKVCVAVDPATSNNKSSDLTGIVVAGKDKDGHIYILADRSLKGSPADWASVVVDCYFEFNADYCVYESNQGGLMVEQTLNSYHKSLPLKSVVARKNKLIRGEPVSLISQQGKLHLVGNFPQLEQQMIEYDGTQKKSPDRLDAMVYAALEMISGKQNVVTSFDFLL